MTARLLARCLLVGVVIAAAVGLDVATGGSAPSVVFLVLAAVLGIAYAVTSERQRRRPDG